MTAASNRSYSPIPFTRVSINDSFWAPRQKTNAEATLRAEYQQLKSTGRIDSLRLDWTPGKTPVPHIFWESDTAKWIEAASCTLASHPDPELARQIDEVIDLLEHAQQPDGYINVYYTLVEPGKRWTNLRDKHELYCAGHLIEAAVAHYRATGSRRLLNIMRRYADCIGQVFGRGDSQKRGYCGHEEIELALIKLARATGDDRYVALARYFVDERGTQPHYFDREAIERGENPADFWAGGYDYNQAALPVRQLNRVAGHSVRAMYLYSAMADLAAIDSDPALKDACERLWRHLCLANMYITGGIGSSRRNEGFTCDYDLPNQTAYAETCAAIGLIFWNHRMLHLDMDGKYADVVERALYNGALSGVSLDGDRFFYENPLASAGDRHRKDWFGCACCPPNIARLLASIGDYVYSESAGGVAVNLYVQSDTTAQVGDTRVSLAQKTSYPWDGRIAVSVSPSQTREFELRLRIPAWCRDHEIAVNGARVFAEPSAGYVAIRRAWEPGDSVVLDLSMPVERAYANPQVDADRGRVALQRGPLVYCVEDADNPAGAHRLLLPRSCAFDVVYRPELLGGVCTLQAQAAASVDDGWQDALYRFASAPATETAHLTAIPYYAWDNRESGRMAVWLPETA